MQILSTLAQIGGQACVGKGAGWLSEDYASNYRFTLMLYSSYILNYYLAIDDLTFCPRILLCRQEVAIYGTAGRRL